MRARPKLGRLCLGLSLLATWATVARTFGRGGLPYPHGISALVDLSALSTGTAGLVLGGLFVGASAAFVWGWRPLRSAVVAAALLALAAHLQSAQWAPGSHQANRAVVLPGAALVAYAVAGLLARRQGRSAAAVDAVGIDAACGVAAACYAIAGGNKLLSSGLGWASDANLSMHMMVHSFGSAPGLGPLRQAVATTPWIASVAGTGTMLIECGFAFFVAPRLRRPLAAAAVAMHLGIGLAMGLHHYDWMFFALGLGLLGGPRPTPAPPPA